MWSVKTFNDLTASELYAIYKLRVKTFVVEQQRVYQEVDEIDPNAIHIFNLINGEIVAYARVFQEGDHCSFGRVVVDRNLRGQHLGLQLIQQILTVIAAQFAHEAVQIEAQTHVQSFYERFGFKAVGDPFLFNHTPHIKMVY